MYVPHVVFCLHIVCASRFLAYNGLHLDFGVHDWGLLGQKPLDRKMPSTTTTTTATATTNFFYEDPLETHPDPIQNVLKEFNT